MFFRDSAKLPAYDPEPLNFRTFLCSTALLHTATEFLHQVVDDSELCYDSETQAWLGMNSDSNKAFVGRTYGATYGSTSTPLLLSCDRQDTPPPASLLVNHVLVHHFLSGKGPQLDAPLSPPSHSLSAAPSPCRLYAQKSCSPCSLSVSTSNSNHVTLLRNATSTIASFELSKSWNSQQGLWMQQKPRFTINQAFFLVLIDLIVERLGLIIKPSDNQTES